MARPEQHHDQAMHAVELATTMQPVQDLDQQFGVATSKLTAQKALLAQGSAKQVQTTAFDDRAMQREVGTTMYVLAMQDELAAMNEAVMQHEVAMAM